MRRRVSVFGCEGHPQVDGSQVRWTNRANAADDYATFRRYLDVVFTYAGTASLSRELQPVDDPARIEQGDVFIQGGFPGHAVLVADVVVATSGERRFLLLQSYMPAQQVHVLRGPDGSDSPWYPARSTGELRTPEWTFGYDDLKRFAATPCDGAGL